MHHSSAEQKEIIMFEITTHDDEFRLEYYVNERKAYKGAIYDFTFEDRFLIYHVDEHGTIIYYAIDKLTDLSSEVTRTNGKVYPSHQYSSMIPHVLKAIRYTGDRRYIGPNVFSPLNLIDIIFRDMMPTAGYAVREEQINLCKQMYFGLLFRKISICEAEVGTGKSLAYLVAAYAANYEGQASGMASTVTIATSSIELQKALITKEIPALSRVLMNCGFLQKPLTAILRKGKEHYLCPRRYLNFLENIKRVPGRYDRLIPELSELEYTKRVLDLDPIPLPASVKQKICVNGGCGNCNCNAACKYSQFVRMATHPMFHFDFQVTNHNMFLMSCCNPNLLKSSTHVIIDEAHKLRDAANDVFGTRLSEKAFRQYYRYLETVAHPSMDEKSWSRHCQRAKLLSDLLFTVLRKLQDENDTEIGRGSAVKISPDLRNRIADLMHEIHFIDQHSSYGNSPYFRFAGNLVKELGRFIENDKLITWVETDENGDLVFCCSQRDNSDALLNNVWRYTGSCVLTSGTMSDGRDFDYFKKENGINRLPESRVQEMSCPSPFAYQKHTRLYIPDDIPYPSNDSETYLNAIADRIVSLVKATNGHTAILY